MGTSRCDIERVHHLNMTTKRFSREYEGVKPVIVEGFVDEKWPARFRGRWARPSLLSSFSDVAVHVSSFTAVARPGIYLPHRQGGRERGARTQEGRRDMSLTGYHAVTIRR